MSSPHSTSTLGGLADAFADPGPDYPEVDSQSAAPTSDGESTTTPSPSFADKTRAAGDRLRTWVDRRRTSPSNEDDSDEFARRANCSTRQLWITRGVQLAVVVALACGPLALLFGGGSSTPTRVATKTPTVLTDISPQLTATDLANQCVTAWLHASQDDQAALGQCFDMGVGGAALPDSPIYDATDARASAVHRVLPAPNGAMIYSVTVSTAVRPAGSIQAPNRRYYRIPVIIAGSSVRALAFPAQVPAPPNSLNTTLGYQYQPPTSSAIVTAARGFLTAMLTGDSAGVTRFTSPGTRLSAITPAPLTSLSVAAAQSTGEVTPTGGTPTDGEQNRLLLTLTERPVGAGVDDTMTASYALSMTARAGRWEVTSVDLAPPITRVSGDQTDTALGDDQAAGNTDSTGIGGSVESMTPQAPATAAPAATSEDPAPAPAAQAPNTQQPTQPASAPAATDPGLLAPGGSDLGPRN